MSISHLISNLRPAAEVLAPVPFEPEALSAWVRRHLREPADLDLTDLADATFTTHSESKWQVTAETLCIESFTGTEAAAAEIFDALSTLGGVCIAMGGLPAISCEAACWRWPRATSCR